MVKITPLVHDERAIMQPGDMDRLLDMAAILCPRTDRIVTTFMDGPPESKGRPRFRRDGRVYKADKDHQAERLTAWHLKRSFNEPWKGNIAIGCIFYRPNRQRIDTDNMLKHVLDCATGICWDDDSQVTAVLGITHLDPDRPRTLMMFGSHDSTMDRGPLLRTCQGCGTSFEVAGPWQKTKYCSQSCSPIFGLDELVPCAFCATPFRRRNRYQKFCSKPCVYDAKRDKARAKARAQVCRDCGNPVSKPEYIRCRSCWKVARSKELS